MKKNIILTVDTEHSIGGAFKNPNLSPVGNEKRIFGKINGREYGLPLIIDIAQEYGFSLSFFVEVLNHYFFGTGETRIVCDYLLRRNQDVQLHIHPNYQQFKDGNRGPVRFSDLIRNYSDSEQFQLIEHARNILIKHGVCNPVAFRAGCYGASNVTLQALEKAGFLMDSSFSRAFSDVSCVFNDTDINDVKQINGIWEFPITNFIENCFVRPRRYMPFDINGVSFREIRYVLEYTDFQFYTVILHSFSFIKALDVQYVRARPRKKIIQRYRNLIRYLAENDSKYQVVTFKDLAENQNFHQLPPRQHIFPEMPAPLTFARIGEQLYDLV